MPIININFSNPWKVRHPYVFRYLPKQFVDDFFRDGSIRISALEDFKRHEDKQRNDATEGSGMIAHSLADYAMMSVISAGRNSLILCGSTSYSPDLGNVFNCDSGFRIDNLENFASAIGRCIPGFLGGSQVPCLYSNIKCSSIKGLGIDPNLLKDLNYKLSLEGLLSAINGLGAFQEVCYLKDIEFKHQCEYRFIWDTDRLTASFIDIKCPEARAYCTRFEMLSEDGILAHNFS